MMKPCEEIDRVGAFAFCLELHDPISKMIR